MQIYPKIYLTGSTGYLGQALSHFLSTRQIQFTDVTAINNAKWRLGDDPSFFETECILIHIAWDMTIDGNSTEGDKNVDGSIKLIQTAIQYKFKIIFISSLSAFEGTRSHYGQTKLRVENFVIDNGGYVVRPGLLWSYQAGPSAILKKFEALVSRLPALPSFNFKQGAQYCTNVENLCEVILEIIRKPNLWDNTKPVYAHKKPYQLSDLLRSIAAAKNKSILIIKIPASIVLFALWCLQKLNLRLFKLDSLIGVLYSDPDPKFSPFANNAREFLR